MLARLNAALRGLSTAWVYGLGLALAAWLGWRAATGGLGIDPVKALERELGLLGLQFLVATLAVTPLRSFAGVNLVRFRRALGLVAFAFVTLHLAVWVLLDLQLRWGEIGADLVKRPYIMLGMAGFALMLPLALTSTDAAIRRLGAVRWRRLHRLTYAAALAGALHFLWLVKAWPLEPLAYVAAVAGLLALRLVPRPRARTA
jgi:sulfoxide reductase heme-binding subunit YedZ